MTKFFIKPAPLKDAAGKAITRIVRMPDRNMRPLAADGQFVERSFFWLRRLRAGDVVIAVPPVKPAVKDEPAKNEAADAPKPTAEPKAVAAASVSKS